jgi:hypothetical protein
VRETLSARLTIDPVRLMALLEVFSYLKTEGMAKTVQLGGIGAGGGASSISTTPTRPAAATTTAFTRSAQGSAKNSSTIGVTRRLTNNGINGMASSVAGKSNSGDIKGGSASTYLHPKLREKLFVRAVEVVRESSTDELWLLILEMAQNGVSKEFDRSPIHIVIAEFARRGVHITKKQKEFLAKRF